MIVVGAPRGGPLTSLVLQSTAWELSRLATVPVMYVPSQ
jgi:nucleotide-binding universal stress UspA family protein